MYYAQIDKNSICYAVTQTAGAIEQSDMIEIASLDESLLGKKRVGDIWEEPSE
jgi:hypothetical protein